MIIEWGVVGAVDGSGCSSDAARGIAEADGPASESWMILRALPPAIPRMASAMAIAGKTWPPVPPAATTTRSGRSAALPGVLGCPGALRRFGADAESASSETAGRVVSRSARGRCSVLDMKSVYPSASHQNQSDMRIRAVPRSMLYPATQKTYLAPTFRSPSRRFRGCMRYKLVSGSACTHGDTFYEQMTVWYTAGAIGIRSRRA